MNETPRDFPAVLRSPWCVGTISAVFGAAIGFFICCTWGQLQPLQRQPPIDFQDPANRFATRVRASDIGHGAAIVGRLGHPIGKRVTIQREWSIDELEEGKLPPKNYEKWLRVTTVNGQRLDEPVIFPSSDVSPIIGGAVEDYPEDLGAEWELDGAETGGYREVPPEALEGLFENRMPRQSVETFGFYTKFLFSSCRIIRHGQSENMVYPQPRAAQERAPTALPNERSPFEIEKP